MGKWIIHYTLVNTSQVMLFINYIREGFRIGLTGCEDEYGNATAIALAPGESRSQGSGFIPTGDIAGKVGRAELTIDYGKKSNELWERMEACFEVGPLDGERVAKLVEGRAIMTSWRTIDLKHRAAPDD